MSDTQSTSKPAAKPAKRPYVPAVGPRLRVLLYFVFTLVALLTANAVYLVGVRLLNLLTSATHVNYFYMWMILLHIVLGLVVIAPFVVFGVMHMAKARKRKNRRAVKIGYALFSTSVIVLVTGVLLTRIVGHFELKQPIVRSVVLWIHAVAPLAAGWLYWLHRLAGPRIKWHIGFRFGAIVAAFVVLMLVMQAQDPREWNAVGSDDGLKYYRPSLVRTSDGNFIPERALNNSQYCLKCHQDVYDGWFHSSHRFSSFNNPAYLATISELRDQLMHRDGNVRASRWCAGCHDPVPFLAGKFDDPEYDIINEPSAHAGITCTVCHAMTHVNSTRGNGDYTIEEPLHYPFAYSDNPMLQWVNNQLVKAKPEFHKQTMLKPLHKTAEFCSTCHKVHLPLALNQYKEFLRGQNHYDAFLLSGVSGHGARSFYYPPKAEKNCNGCHMPLAKSDDFGAKDFDKSGKLKIHSHLFPAANTGIVSMLPDDKLLHKNRRHGITRERRETTIRSHQEFLNGVMRVDIFGVKEGGTIDGKLHALLRPKVPTLKPGRLYLVETVIRTVKMGHTFTQGTTDSNEVWMDVTVRNDNRVIGRSGGMDDRGEVDRWAHFVNVYMLDRNGDRINRRNAQDIFTPLYNHQIPPGAAQVVHYLLETPPDPGPIHVEVKLQYRKFDAEYMRYVAGFHQERNLPLRGIKPGQHVVNQLPITTLAEDRIVFQVAEHDQTTEAAPSPIPEWQRWNDYGIALLLEGESSGREGELRQAEEAFLRVKELGKFHGPLNLARVYNLEPRFDEAVAELNALQQPRFGDQPGFPTWTVAWLSGMINKEQGNLDEAISNFRKVVEDNTSEMQRRGFDFSRDYKVLNELGSVLVQRAYQEEGLTSRKELLERARSRFEQTLSLDSENAIAHYRLSQVLEDLARLRWTEKSDTEPPADSASAKLMALSNRHRELHQRYKPDDNAPAVRTLARQKHAAANRAAEPLVRYSLHRKGAPELPRESQCPEPLD